MAAGADGFDFAPAMAEIASAAAVSLKIAS
jgi:hypothetical protein